MGSVSSHAGADEKPVHLVQLSGYCVDVDEVSVQDFATWLNTDKRTPEGSDIRSLTKTKDGWSAEEERRDHPAEGVTWKEANYCIAKVNASYRLNGKSRKWWMNRGINMCDPKTYGLSMGLLHPPVNYQSSAVCIGLPNFLCSNTQASELNEGQVPTVTDILQETYGNMS